MSAPVVLQATPSDQETDVVLGQAIIVAFDQALDTSTLNDSTFSLTFPAPTQVLTSGQLVERREEWEGLLSKGGFRQLRSLTENEWFGSAWISSNG